MSTVTAAPRRILAHAALAALVLLPAVGTAQSAPAARRTLELRLPTGALIATGDQRHALKDAQASGAQLSWRVRPQVAITGTFAWARSRDLAAAATPKLDVFTSDVGLELRTAERVSARGMSLSGFAGFGGGARSYNYRKGDIDATHNLAGYASAGGELGIGRVAMRVEARDYASGFRPLAGAGTSAARNDVSVMVAFRFNRKQPQS